MTILDDRGRLFGRFNLIDAAVVIVVLVLVPVTYAAYLLFRPEPMKIHAVEPARVIVGQQPRVRLHGEHFRPYLRAQVGSAQPHNFLIESPNEGEMVLPELPVGTFDLALYDEVSEVARLKNAITVAPPPQGPRVNLQLAGAFYGLEEAAARAIAKGRRFPDDASALIEVIDAGEPREDVRRVKPVPGSDTIVVVPVRGSWQVPATIRAACLPGGENQNCGVNGTVIGPGAMLPVPGGFSFVIDQVRADAPTTMVTVRAQFTGRPEAIGLIAVGDVDVSASSGDAARIVALRDRQTVAGQVSRQTTSGSVVETSTMPERLSSVDATIVLGADQTPAGLGYRSTPIKPGSLLTFETAKYLVRGAIVSVTPAAPPARPK